MYTYHFLLAPTIKLYSQVTTTYLHKYRNKQTLSSRWSPEFHSTQTSSILHKMKRRTVSHALGFSTRKSSKQVRLDVDNLIILWLIIRINLSVYNYYNVYFDYCTIRNGLIKVRHTSLEISAG
ncbi:hypothetical protein KC19_8G071800 [Ceratodon purpureus]|uniref:Uncharacterized protein n=1 Tax=Ceratodon purpureus TaxID=3225 RepID=A0A8T0H0S6_CERPU|nr:hypothetical protein KC19_8G071800 [Ceratodon purpureus]